MNLIYSILRRWGNIQNGIPKQSKCQTSQKQPKYIFNRTARLDMVSCEVWHIGLICCSATVTSELQGPRGSNWTQNEAAKIMSVWRSSVRGHCRDLGVYGPKQGPYVNRYTFETKITPYFPSPLTLLQAHPDRPTADTQHPNWIKS